MGDASLPSAAPLITHIVLFKYRSDITWTELQAHFDVFLQLPKKCVNKEGINYMVSMKAGKDQSWEPHSKGMTHGFVLEFASQADLDYYLTEDPIHLAFSKAAKLLIEDSVVVDIHNRVLFGPSPPAPTISKTYNGSCHCQQIRWTAQLEDAKHILCHCSTCQKLGGGPYSLNAIIDRSELQILSGEPKTYIYVGASGKEVRCYYCGNCTSHIYHQQEIMGEKIIVRTILLEGGSDMAVGGEIFKEGSLGWVKELGKVLPDA
ncbi:Mss4-like protein [Halenospora varia]|nr:Mss4-like protein [Halenospora varia]